MFNKTRQKELTETGKSELYTDLTKLIIKIADYIFRKEEDIRKGIGDIMGGKVQQTQKDVSSYIKNTIFKKNGKRQISF